MLALLLLPHPLALLRQVVSWDFCFSAKICLFCDIIPPPICLFCLPAAYVWFPDWMSLWQELSPLLLVWTVPRTIGPWSLIEIPVCFLYKSSTHYSFKINLMSLLFPSCRYQLACCCQDARTKVASFYGIQKTLCKCNSSLAFLLSILYVWCNEAGIQWLEKESSSPWKIEQGNSTVFLLLGMPKGEPLKLKIFLIHSQIALRD